jgi:hypothetical protein
MIEQGRMQQPTINGSSNGELWLATRRVRGQRLAMAVKGGGSRRRDCCGQRGVIPALEAAKASWIWMTKMHATESDGKQEDGSIFWWRQQLLCGDESSPGDGSIKIDVK